GTSLAFSTMLAVVLAGIGIGGLGGAALLSRRPDADRHLPILASLGGAAIVTTYVGFGWMAQQFTRLGLLLHAETLFLAIALMLPSALLSGVLFTLIGHAFQREIQGEIRPAGLVTLANTLGAMLGSAIGGFLLLPMLGIEYSLQLLACAYTLVSAILWVAGFRSNRLATVVVVASVILSVFHFPTGAMRGYMDRILTPHTKRGAEVVAIKEGLTETSMLLAKRVFGSVASYKLLTNSFSMSTTNEHARRYMKLFVYWPVAIHPAPKKALLISYGVGATAQALIDTRGLEMIDIVDISKDILDYSSTIYPEHKRNPLLDPRVTVHVEDGRHYLETRQQSYDLITGEPPPPKIAGIVSLFTEEYFAAVRKRLSEGGIVTYWLPVHGLLESDSKAIIRAFCNVFEDCSLWNGASLDWIMVGTRGLKTPVPIKNFVQQWQDPLVLPELRALGVERPEQLGALFIGDSEFLKELTKATPPLNDDHPGRLSSVVIGPRIAREIYRDWLDPTAALARFDASTWVRELWPTEIHAKSLGYFKWQSVVVDFLASELGGPDKILPILAAIQDETSLETLPLWVVGTSQRIQELAIRATAAGRTGIGIDRANALGALAAGDYEKAIASAEGRPPARIQRYLRIYALGEAGKIKEARQLLLSMPQRHRNKAADLFLENRFGFNAIWRL
ncbi:MAG: spermidine synthase, partial [Myxococcota bacterium]